MWIRRINLSFFIVKFIFFLISKFFLLSRLLFPQGANEIAWYGIFRLYILGAFQWSTCRCSISASIWMVFNISFFFFFQYKVDGFNLESDRLYLFAHHHEYRAWISSLLTFTCHCVVVFTRQNHQTDNYWFHC